MINQINPTTIRKTVVNERTAPKILPLDVQYNAQVGLGPIPYNQEAEEAVLGAIIAQPHTYYDVVKTGLLAEDFYIVRHTRVFRAMEMIEAEAGIATLDLVILGDKLKTLGWLDEIGGSNYLSKLMNSTDGSSTNAIVRASLITRKATRRRILVAVDEIRKLALDETLTLEESILQSEEKFIGATERSFQDESSDSASIAQMYWDWLDAARETGGVQALPTGFKELDELIKLYRGNVAYLAGMTGMGKTQILVEVARHVALNLKKRVIFFTHEMTQIELYHRLVAIETGIPIERIKEPSLLSKEEMAHVTAALGNIAQWKLNIIEFEKMTPHLLYCQLKALQRQYAIELVIVDGLWLMETDEQAKNDTRHNDMNEITGRLRTIAAETNLRLLVSHQMNRNAVGRKDHTPILTDLADAFAINWNAQVVLALYREDYPDFRNVGATTGFTQIHAIKVRDCGKSGIANMCWTKGRYLNPTEATLRNIDLRNL